MWLKPWEPSTGESTRLEGNMQYPTAKRSKAGITLEHAKKLCVEKFGKLPARGKEAPIRSGTDEKGGRWVIWLQNNSGHFAVWKYTRRD